VKSALNVGIKLLVSAGLLYYLLLRSDLDAVTDVFAQTAFSFFWVAVLCFVASNALGAFQWFLLLGAQDLRVSFRQAVVFYWIGVFFNNVLLGNIGGDAMRIYDVRRVTGQISAGVAATVMDRFIGLFSTCTLALLTFLLVAEVRPAGLVAVLLPVWGGLVILLAMGLSRRAGSFLERQTARVLPVRLADTISSLRRSIVVYRHRPKLLLSVWAVSLSVQFCRILVYWYAGLAVGLSAGLVYFIAFQPVAAVIAALPISIGGLGVRENVLVGLFHQVGTSDDAIIAMSLLGYSAGIVASLLGGIAFVIRKVERPDSQDANPESDTK
jgi:uncharacterized protein (TIRG00374 family)